MTVLALSGGPGARSAEIWPTRSWGTITPAAAGLDSTLLAQAVAYGQARGGSGFIVRYGQRVAGWGNPAAVYDLFSSTKSFGSLLLGFAVTDHKLGLGDKGTVVLPGFGVPPQSNKGTGWLPLITVEQLADHSAGFDKDGGYRQLLFRPGTAWSYSDGGANWLADLVTTVYQRDLVAILRKRLLTPLQIDGSALSWRASQKRPVTLNGVTRREFHTGITASVDAMARVGLFVARGGRWQSRQLIVPSYVAVMRTARPALAGLAPLDPTNFPGATQHYGLLWWNNNDGTMKDVPTDAFWSWGKHESFILAIPSLDLVAARAGTKGWSTGWSGRYSVLEPFFSPLARAAAP